jgi:hypothetical protein
VSWVFVVDGQRRPLTPVHPGQARRLLTSGKAAVLYRYPFTIVLERSVPDAQPVPLRLKIDPGSKTTGLAVLNETGGLGRGADSSRKPGEGAAKSAAALPEISPTAPYALSPAAR